jgi:hypothetical protein
MGIKFDVKEVRNYFESHSFVYTLRHPRSVGQTLATYNGGTKKNPVQILLADVDVSLVDEAIVVPEQLYDYVFMSGLGASETLDKQGLNQLRDEIAKKWLSLAQRLSGPTLNLYMVKLLKKR